jgi:hypothetical protein
MEGGRYSRTHAIHYEESGPESSDFTSKDDIKYQTLKRDVVKFRYENPSCILRNYVMTKRLSRETLLDKKGYDWRGIRTIHKCF